MLLSSMQVGLKEAIDQKRMSQSVPLWIESRELTGVVAGLFDALLVLELVLRLVGGGPLELLVFLFELLLDLGGGVLELELVLCVGVPLELLD